MSARTARPSRRCSTSWWRASTTSSLHLFAIKDSKGKAQIKLVDASGLLHRDRSFLLTLADFPTQHQGVFYAYLAAAQQRT